MRTRAIGLLSPNLNEAKLEDARRILPGDTRIVGHSFRVQRYTDSEFAVVEQRVLDGVSKCAEQPLDFLMLTGELLYSHLGQKRHEEILAFARSSLGKPVSSIVEAVKSAFSRLGAERVLLASPFAEGQTDKLEQFLANCGVLVADRVCLGYQDSDSIWALDPQSAYDAAQSLMNKKKNADCIYMPNNQWRVTTAIDAIERDFKMPVVANTPAWISEALNALNMKQPIKGYGALLATR